MTAGAFSRNSSTLTPRRAGACCNTAASPIDAGGQKRGVGAEFGMIDWDDLSNKIGAARRQLRAPSWASSCPNPVLTEALGRWAGSPADIHDHLGALFAETVAARPRLIVELGTRGGISTRALLAAAEVSDAHLLSVDIV